MSAGAAARIDRLSADVAQVMKRSSLRGKVLTLIAGARADLATPDPPPPPTPPPPLPPAVSPLHGLVNQHRRDVGAQLLTVDAEAERIAQGWAETMAASGDFHHNPNLAADVSDPWYSVGENIAWGYPDEAAVHQGWMDSPPHRRNVEGTAFTALGVGRAASASGRPYWVEVFVDRLP